MLGQDRHPKLINTLPEESFAETRLPKSVNIPLDRDDFVDRVEKEIGARNQPVVVYCASADCDSSSKAAHKLEEAGFTNVMEFEGGAKGWQEAGEQLAGSA